MYSILFIYKNKKSKYLAKKKFNLFKVDNFNLINVINTFFSISFIKHILQFDILSFLFVLKLFFTEYFLFQKLFEMLLLVNTVTKLNLKSFISRKELGNMSSLVQCIYFVHFFFVSNSNIDVQFNLKNTYKTPVQTKRTN